MKISEVIELLEEAKKEVGDVEFVIMTEVDGRFIVEGNRNIDIIELPPEDLMEGVGKAPEGPIVAVFNFDIEQVISED